MITKLQAADVARRAGTNVIIASGHAPAVILRAAAGEKMGTHFPALENPLESRKRWILAGPKPAGVIIIDAGAQEALCAYGRSLLPAGIIAIQGDFQRGDTIIITSEADQILARGITRYSGRDLSQIAGIHSEEIEACLGYAYGPVAVHRNDLILL
jgi:glutamate 5-kinase